MSFIRKSSHTIQKPRTRYSSSRRKTSSSTPKLAIDFAQLGYADVVFHPVISRHAIDIEEHAQYEQTSEEVWSLIACVRGKNIFEVGRIAVVEALVDPQEHTRHQTQWQDVEALEKADFGYFVCTNVTARAELQENLQRSAHVAARQTHNQPPDIPIMSKIDLRIDEK